jgi:hypothetical protein
MSTDLQTAITVKAKPKEWFLSALDEARVLGYGLRGHNAFLEMLLELFRMKCEPALLAPRKVELAVQKFAKIAGKPTSITASTSTRKSFRLAKAEARLNDYPVKTDWEMLVLLVCLWKVCRARKKLPPVEEE